MEDFAALVRRVSASSNDAVATAAANAWRAAAGRLPGKRSSAERRGACIMLGFDKAKVRMKKDAPSAISKACLCKEDDLLREYAKLRRTFAAGGSFAIPTVEVSQLALWLGFDIFADQAEALLKTFKERRQPLRVSSRSSDDLEADADGHFFRVAAVCVAALSGGGRVDLNRIAGQQVHCPRDVLEKHCLVLIEACGIHNDPGVQNVFAARLKKMRPAAGNIRGSGGRGGDGGSQNRCGKSEVLATAATAAERSRGAGAAALAQAISPPPAAAAGSASLKRPRLAGVTFAESVAGSASGGGGSIGPGTGAGNNSGGSSSGEANGDGDALITGGPSAAKRCNAAAP
ncbi:unnamed protein product, partial [Phaeothamnion confervicola]